MKKRIRLLLIIVCITTLAMGVARIKPITDNYLCVGCKDCVKICPVNAITLIDGKSVIDEVVCINCKRCIKSCTYNAIKDRKQ